MHVLCVGVVVAGLDCPSLNFRQIDSDALFLLYVLSVCVHIV